MRHYQIKAQGSTAEVRLIGNISWWANSGADFTNQIDQLLQAGVTTLRGYINSGGGDVIEANEVVNQLKRIPKLEKVNLGAICASAATAIAIEFEQVEMAPNGLFMIHNMYGGVEGTAKEIQSYVNLMNTLSQNYINRMCQLTGMSPAQIQEMMDATTWMNATTAKDKKFITSIAGQDDEDTGVLNSIKNFGYKNIPVSVKNLIEPTKNPSPTQNPIMKQRIISALALGMGMKLSADTADESLAAAVENMANELVTTKAELERVKTSTAKAKAKILIDNAVNLKKITEDEREQYMEDAIANFELTERVLNKIPGVTKVSQQLNNESGSEHPDRKDWTLKDYKEKDPKALLEMRTKNKPLYMKLYEAHYGVPCNMGDRDEE